jgi:hypothetical protein
MTDKVWPTKKKELGRNRKEILFCGITFEGKEKTHFEENCRLLYTGKTLQTL